VNGYTLDTTPTEMGKSLWGIDFEAVPWLDPNVKNLVAEGKQIWICTPLRALLMRFSVNSRDQDLFARTVQGFEPSLRPTRTSCLR
jgi:hypothetical protein